MLTGRVVTFQRLMRQWQLFGNSTKKLFLRVVREEVCKKTEESGYRVRREQETAYKVSSTELDEYGDSLLADLKKIEALVSQEKDPIKEDTGDEQPTQISEWKEKEASKELPKNLEVVVDEQQGEEVDEQVDEQEIDEKEEEEEDTEEDAEEEAEADEQKKVLFFDVM